MSIRDLLKCTMFAVLYGLVGSLSFVVFFALDISVVKLICSAVIIICLLIYNVYYFVHNYNGIIALFMSVIYELASAFISFWIFTILFMTIFDVGVGLD